MKHTLTALLLAACCVFAQAGEPPRRIVSLNLCTDQLLLELVPHDRIAMLSNLAADETISWHAAQARAFPRFDGQAESVVRLAPDLVLAGSMASRDSVGVLARLGFAVQVLEMPESLDAALALIGRIGELTGEREAAARLHAATVARLDAVNRSTGGGRPLAVIYLPSGISPGTGTLKHELLEAAGWRNLAAVRGIQGYGTIPLEALLLAAPDALFFDEVDQAQPSLSRQALRHPALLAHAATFTMPSAAWICGGAQVADAVERLAAARQAMPNNARRPAIDSPGGGL